MHAPAYLHVSRHRVFYLRWPLPKALHPLGKPSTIKVSLDTRDRRQALHLARSLGYLAEQLIAGEAAAGMKYEDIRAVLKLHFSNMLTRKKEQIATTGRLDWESIVALKNGEAFAQDAINRNEPQLMGEDDASLLARFTAQYDLSIEPHSPAYESLRVEIKRAYRDYCRAVLNYDRSLDDYTFTQPATTPGEVTRITGPVTPLHEAGDRYIEENIRGNRWGEKTQFEKGQHVTLLYEILGQDTDIRTVTAPKAQTVKQTLLRYPRNRNKNPKTRGLSLQEALAVPGVEKLNVQTINKYLATYSGLFIWAKKNGYVDEAVFSGFTIRQNKNQGKSGRSGFGDTQVNAMLDELIHNHKGLVRKDYQKWGPLIGLYTGARLNEISQIHLSDIRQEQGIWCFDLNDDDEGKHLKNEASRRLVPMHPRLIGLGFLDHVKSMQLSGKEKLFPDFSHCSKNGWGRALGRWFNDSFLKKMGMTDNRLVFHSLRHTVVTTLLRHNVPEPIVKAIVGHAQKGVTQQNYFKEGYTLQQMADAMNELPWPNS